MWAAGGGELLGLLRDAGVAASGVDSDAGMAAAARAGGLDVVVGDAVEHLAGVPDGGLGAITAIHVVEHLPYPVLLRLLSVAVRKLRPGGILVTETVNPHAPAALKTFWVDPTHQHPIYPEVALTLARGAGFASAYITHLRGQRVVERDRFAQDSYALVAERA
jgi:SAM-dependent methyltransferase